MQQQALFLDRGRHQLSFPIVPMYQNLDLTAFDLLFLHKHTGLVNIFTNSVIDKLKLFLFVYLIKIILYYSHVFTLSRTMPVTVPSDKVHREIFVLY